VYTHYEYECILMKKERKQLWIDEELYARIVHMLKVNPVSGYKSRTQFVEKAVEEKLDKMETELVLRSIKEEGIMEFKESARAILKTGMQMEKRHAEVVELIEQYKQLAEENKRLKHKKAKLKHTYRVYKPKKK